jgi:hypothetical protein
VIQSHVTSCHLSRILLRLFKHGPTKIVPCWNETNFVKAKPKKRALHIYDLSKEVNLQCSIDADGASPRPLLAKNGFKYMLFISFFTMFIVLTTDKSYSIKHSSEWNKTRILKVTTGKLSFCDSMPSINKLLFFLKNILAWKYLKDKAWKSEWLDNQNLRFNLDICANGFLFCLLLGHLVAKAAHQQEQLQDLQRDFDQARAGPLIYCFTFFILRSPYRPLYFFFIKQLLVYYFWAN